MTDEPLITLGVRPSEDYEDTWEVYVELGGETHYESEEIAREAMAEYLASMGPAIMEPARCILIPRPERHISTIKIFKNSHMIKFCVPCRVYTTISVCPCCGLPTLGAGRLPGVEDAGVRAKREAKERDARLALKAPHGTVSDTPDGPVIEVDARPVENPNGYYVDQDPPPPSTPTTQQAAEFESRLRAVPMLVRHRAPWPIPPYVNDPYRAPAPEPPADPLAEALSSVPVVGAIIQAVENVAEVATSVATADDPTNELADPEHCRRCTDCVGLPHHWEVDYVAGDDEEEGDAEMVWGCKHCDLQFPRHCDLGIVDYALHTQTQPEMVLAGNVGCFVEHLASEHILIQLQMPDRTWHTVKEVKPYNGPSHILFLWDTGFCRRHTAELLAWRPILAPCECSTPDGPCEGCDDPHGHTCRACDEEWCQACWLLTAHAESCPATTRADRAG